MRDTDVQREIKRMSKRYDDDDIQEYTRPWRPLTEQELQARGVWWNSISGGQVRDCAKEIETKLKDKNHG
jgi:hypothetical protein